MITDSTAFQLPDELETLLKGVSESASKSRIKIQLTNDLLTGNIVGIDITDAKTSNEKYLKILEYSYIC